MARWSELIAREMERQGEGWGDVHTTTLDGTGLGKEFNAACKGPQGQAFTLWTEERVYFPVVCDDDEWVSSVPRDPCDEATEHIGGG